jgi:hypothetical protein
MRTLRSVKFLFTAPFILVLLAVINWMTEGGLTWFKWAALGIGIAWFIAVLRVMRAIILIGGIAAFGTWLAQRNKGGGTGAGTGF